MESLGNLNVFNKQAIIQAVVQLIYAAKGGMSENERPILNLCVRVLNMDDNMWQAGIIYDPQAAFNSISNFSIQNKRDFKEFILTAAYLGAKTQDITNIWNMSEIGRAHV